MKDTKYILYLLPGYYAVCQLPSHFSRIPAWLDSEHFTAIVRTYEELSIVCQQERVPIDINSEKNWRLLKVKGPLELSQIGVLAALSASLARAEVSIFVISTYDTDYLMVKEPNLPSAIEALEGEGHQVLRS